MRVAIIQRSEDYKNAQRYANGLQAAAIQWHCGSAMGASYHFPDLHFTGERTCHLLLTCAEGGQHLSFCDPFCMQIAIYKYVPFLTLPWPAFCFACGCGRDQISELTEQRDGVW